MTESSPSPGIRASLNEAGELVLTAVNAPPEAVELADLVTLRATVEQAIADAVAGQRENGKTWAQIGAGLGVTKNAALMRYGR